MTRTGLIWIVAAFAIVLFGQQGLNAQAKAAAPDFKEVYDLLRANVTGLTEADLNRAAVQGLLAELGSRASLVNNGAPDETTDSPAVARATVFENDIAYIRIRTVNGRLPAEFKKAHEQLSATNKLKGIVVDLRYASGRDYAAAAAVADLFVSKAQPLLDWGNGAVSSRDKKDSIRLPVAALVNRETAGAAEALAAVFRGVGAGLILGGTTAGQAMVMREFTLQNGQQLLLASAPVKLGDGSALPVQGLKPDIAVTVSADDEREYYADAFRALCSGTLLADAGLTLTNQPDGTNRSVRRPRINEADLVRERREGVSREPTAAPVRDADAERATVHDPALARALDLLKGLAVVRQSRS